MRPFHAVIMAGGSGTRFWPASRTARPKQFLPLLDGVTLLAATVDRARSLVGPERTWIVTNPIQAAALPALLPDFPGSRVITEPEARDTAPCVALASAVVGAQDEDAVMAFLPADHLIEPLETFHALLRRGAGLALDDRTLVTFGIEPSFPATDYGYIEAGELLDDLDPPAWAVRNFREKPDRATAEGFLERSGLFWNSGIFVWTRKALTAAMAAGNADLFSAAAAMERALRRKDTAALEKAFRSAPKTSVDYAVMEHAPHIAVVQANLGWDDLGSFLALEAIAPRDGDGNVGLTLDGARFTALKARDNTVYAEGPRMVALFGVDHLVVVAVGDAVLVCPKERAGDMKTLLAHLETAGFEDLL